MCDCLQILYNMWETCEYICMQKHNPFTLFCQKRMCIFTANYASDWACVCLCVMNKGDSEDAAVDCGSQHVQELLHHRGHVPPSPLLCICWRCSLWNCQIWREHQPVRIRSSVYAPHLSDEHCRLYAVDAVKKHLYRVVWFCLSPLIAGMPTSPQRARLSLFSSALSQGKIGIKSCMTAW